MAQRYAQKDSRIRALQQPNGGVAAARNRALAETNPNSEFLIFLDNDDLWEPDTLEVLVQALDANPACVAAHGLACSIDSQGKQPAHDNLEQVLREERCAIVGNRCVPWPLDKPTTFAALAAHNCIVTPGLMLVRRSVIQKIGGFDPMAVPCDDWDLSLRISRHGDIAFLNRVLLQWRRHESNQSDRSSGWKRAYHYVRRKILVSRDNTPEQRRIARRAYLAICLDQMSQARTNLLRGRLKPFVRDCYRTGYSSAQYLRATFGGRLPEQP